MGGGRGGGVPLKLWVSSLGEPTKSGRSSLRYAPSGVRLPPELPRTKGDGTPTRGDLLSAGRGGTGLVGAGDEACSVKSSTSSSNPSLSRQTGGESEGEKLGGRGGAGSSGGGPRTMEGGESGGEKGGGEPGEKGGGEGGEEPGEKGGGGGGGSFGGEGGGSLGGEGGGSLGGGPGERQGVDGVDEGVSGAGDSGGGGGAGSSGGGGLSPLKVTHLGDAVSSLVRGLSTGPNTSSRSGPGERR